MSHFKWKLHWDDLVGATRGMGIGSWILIVVLLILLVWAIVVSHLGWNLSAGTQMPASGYAALIIGVLFSLIVGVGLMALVFYSSRYGYDEPPQQRPSDTDDDERRMQ